MVCTPTNVYPNNACVDAEFPYFGFTFYGDSCAGCSIRLFDYDTGEQCASMITSYGYQNKGFYNGDRFDYIFPCGAGFGVVPDKEFLWKIRFYEKVDVANGYYPTIKHSSGVILINPVLKVTVESVSIDEKTFVLKDPVTHTWYLEYIYWEGHGRRKIVGYNLAENSITLDSAFDSIPQNVEGDVDELYLSRIKTDISNLNQLIQETADVPRLGEDFETETTSNIVFIEPNLSFRYGSGVILDGNQDEKRIYDSYICNKDGSYYPIEKYYPLTGRLELSESITFKLSDRNYKLFYAFVDSPYYYFYTKNKPAITPSLSINASGLIYCEAEMSKAGEYNVNYYYWEVYKGNELVVRSEKIYSGRLDYLFRMVESGEEYSAKIIVVVNDGLQVESDFATITHPEGDYGYVTDLYVEQVDDLNAVKLTWEIASGISVRHYNIYRKNTATDKIEFLGTKDRYYNNGVYSTSAIPEITEFYDYTCLSDVEYEYSVLPVRSSESICHNITTDPITTSFSDWTVYFVDEYPYTPKSFFDEDETYNWYGNHLTTMYNDRRFIIHSAWKVQVEAELNDIEHNISRETNITYTTKPVTTYGDNEYDSFTLKFVIGEFSCNMDEFKNGGINWFKRWKNEINSQRTVVIKDDKGFMWVGDIVKHTYNPKYDVLQHDFIETQIQFNQTMDNNKVRILDNTIGVK